MTRVGLLNMAEKINNKAENKSEIDVGLGNIPKKYIRKVFKKLQMILSFYVESFEKNTINNIKCYDDFF